MLDLAMISLLVAAFAATAGWIWACADVTRPTTQALEKSR